MRHCRDAEANDMIDMGSDHRSVLGHLTFPDTKKCDSQTDDKKDKGTRKSTRFANQTGNTGEIVESISLQEERFLELGKRLTKKEAAAAPNEATMNGDEKEALHESASEAAATTREETEVAKKTLETGPKTAAEAAKSHDEPPQQKTTAANEETEVTTAKSHDKSPHTEAATATQRKTRVHQKTGDRDSNETAAKMDSKGDELKALIERRNAMDKKNKDQLNDSEASRKLRT